MKTASSPFRHGAWTLGTALIFVHQAAQACPGCKQAAVDGKTALNGVSIGFGVSIFFMIFMVFAILGGLGYMMYRSCRIIAAQQQAAMEQEDTLSAAEPA